MDIHIPDHVVASSGKSERDFLVDVACHLYDAGVIEKPDATRLCGLDRPTFEAELYRRNLAVYRVSLEDIEQDLKVIENSNIRKAS